MNAKSRVFRKNPVGLMTDSHCKGASHVRDYDGGGIDDWMFDDATLNVHAASPSCSISGFRVLDNDHDTFLKRPTRHTPFISHFSSRVLIGNSSSSTRCQTQRQQHIRIIIRITRALVQAASCHRITLSKFQTQDE